MVTRLLQENPVPEDDLPFLKFSAPRSGSAGKRKFVTNLSFSLRLLKISDNISYLVRGGHEQT